MVPNDSFSGEPNAAQSCLQEGKALSSGDVHTAGQFLRLNPERPKREECWIGNK